MQEYRRVQAAVHLKTTTFTPNCKDFTGKSQHDEPYLACTHLYEAYIKACLNTAFGNASVSLGNALLSTVKRNPYFDTKGLNAWRTVTVCNIFYGGMSRNSYLTVTMVWSTETNLILHSTSSAHGMFSLADDYQVESIAYLVSCDSATITHLHLSLEASLC